MLYFKIYKAFQTHISLEIHNHPGSRHSQADECNLCPCYRWGHWLSGRPLAAHLLGSSTGHMVPCIILWLQTGLDVSVLLWKWRGKNIYWALDMTCVRVWHFLFHSDKYTSSFTSNFLQASHEMHTHAPPARDALCSPYSCLSGGIRGITPPV